MSSQNNIQSLYNELFEHIENRKNQMTYSQYAAHYWYHFLYSIGIAAWIDFPRAVKYGEVIERFHRYQAQRAT